MPHHVFTRPALYDRVWAEPICTVARSLGVSDVGLAKACRAADIPTPPRDWWAKLQHGKPPPLNPPCPTAPTTPTASSSPRRALNPLPPPPSNSPRPTPTTDPKSSSPTTCAGPMPSSGAGWRRTPNTAATIAARAGARAGWRTCRRHCPTPTAPDQRPAQGAGRARV